MCNHLHLCRQFLICNLGDFPIIFMLSCSVGDDEALDAPRSSYGNEKHCVLHKMIFTNFKSYAQIQVVGPFDNVCLLFYFVFLVIYSRRWSQWLWKVQYH